MRRPGAVGRCSRPADDRRGIYTELTAAGRALYARAQPIHDEALERVLSAAADQPELAPVVDELHRLVPAL